MGFLKLGDYGLILTPEGRVLSTHSTVLDDGLGGKIVGWREGDLAAMELDRWQSGPATPRATANPTAIPAPIPPAPSAPATRVVAAPPPVPARPLGGPVATVQSPVLAMAPLGPKRAPTPIPLETQPMIRVDEIAEPLEDEWEWEIAVARARAQAEWADEAAQQTQVAAPPELRPAPPVVAPTPPLRVRAKSPTAPIAVVATAKPPIADRWDTSDRTKTTTTAAPAPPPRIVPTTPTRPVAIVSPVTQTGRTVIPVPTITQVTDPSLVRPRARMTTGAIPVRPSAAVMSAAPRRFPRATPQPEKLGEDTQVTQVTQAGGPANDDLTTPGLVLPPSLATSSNSKRVAAKQR